MTPAGYLDADAFVIELSDNGVTGGTRFVEKDQRAFPLQAQDRLQVMEMLLLQVVLSALFQKAGQMDFWYGQDHAPFFWRAKQIHSFSVMMFRVMKVSLRKCSSISDRFCSMIPEITR